MKGGLHRLDMGWNFEKDIIWTEKFLGKCKQILKTHGDDPWLLILNKNSIMGAKPEYKRIR